MRREFGWQGSRRRAGGPRRARDWDDRPPADPPLHGPWEHLPRIAAIAALIGIAAGASLITTDLRAHDRVLAAAGFTPDGTPL